MLDKEEMRRSSIIVGSSVDVVQRYGSAVKAHMVAYHGNDFEAGKFLNRNLRGVSNSKINQAYKSQNIIQQSGFSAEIKETARINAQRIVNGDKKRLVRTDDIGSANDQILDHVDVTLKGKVIRGTGSQMKFVGNSSDDLFKKLLSPKYEKYLNEDAKIVVPSDLYDSTMDRINGEIPRLEEKLLELYKIGKTEEYQRVETKLKNIKKLSKSLRKSTLSRAEAQYARIHPELSTLKDTLKIAHQGSAEVAKSASIITGSLSLVKNSVAYIKGEIDKKEALSNVAGETVHAAVVGYATGFSGSYLKGVMQNSSSEFLRKTSKTNMAATVTTATLTMSKIITSYLNGDITGIQCFEDLGESGVSIIASSVYSAIGQAAIPIPVVGAVIGSVVGYSMSSMTYKTLLEALQDAKYSREERLIIETACHGHIALLKEYRKDLHDLIGTHLVTQLGLFSEVFTSIKYGLNIDDVDGYIQNLNELQIILGKDVQFNSMNELDDFMRSDIPFKF